jgi:hypothetical protein
MAASIDPAMQTEKRGFAGPYRNSEAAIADHFSRGVPPGDPTQL